MLFAPTYRGKNIFEADYDFDVLDLDKIYNALGDDYVFCFKWHPYLVSNLKRRGKVSYDLSPYKGFYKDLSEYREINDLLLVTDVLVTDYSSVIFDYSLLKKPLVFFTYDMDTYDGLRGMYFPFEDYVYGSITKTMDELIKAIRDEDMCTAKRSAFAEKFMSECDGTSTLKTCDYIFGKKWSVIN